MNTWLLFSLLGPMFWAMTNPLDAALRRYFVKDEIALTWFLTLFRFVLAVILFFIFGDIVEFNWGLVALFTAGTLWTLPLYFYFRALEFEEPSRVALFNQVLPVFVLLIAWFFIGEMLSANQLFAFGLIFIGGILAAFKRINKKWHISQAFPLIIFAAFLWASSDVMFKHFSAQFPDFTSAFLLYFIGAGLPALIMFFFPKKSFTILESYKTLSFKGWMILFSSMFFGIAGSASFAYALTLGEASLTAVLIGLQPLFVFVFGWILSVFINEVKPESLKSESLVFKLMSLFIILAGLFYLN